MNDVLADFFGSLLKSRHLFLVTQDAHYIIACYDAQFRKQCPQHLQVLVPDAIEHHRVDVF
jgi:hypothetical protein